MMEKYIKWCFLLSATLLSLFGFTALGELALHKVIWLDREAQS